MWASVLCCALYGFKRHSVVGSRGGFNRCNVYIQKPLTWSLQHCLFSISIQGHVTKPAFNAHKHTDMLSTDQEFYLFKISSVNIITYAVFQSQEQNPPTLRCSKMTFIWYVSNQNRPYNVLQRTTYISFRLSQLQLCLVSEKANHICTHILKMC